MEKYISEKFRKKIIDTLDTRGALSPCSRCGKAEFFLADGYVVQQMQGRFDGINWGGSYIPCVALVCNNCGNISLHSLGVLGLMEEAEKDGP